MRGVDDLDFYIGDDAVDKPTYATKVIQIFCLPCCHYIAGYKLNILLLFLKIVSQKITNVRYKSEAENPLCANFLFSVA